MIIESARRSHGITKRLPVNKSPKLLLFPYRHERQSYEIMGFRELREYVHAWRYLQAHQGALDARVWFGKNATELSGEWYGLMYIDRPNSFRSPHLLTPSLSDRSNFAVGTGDLFVTGTAGVTSIIPKDGRTDTLYYLLGLLNSDLLSFYIVNHSPPYQGGYRKFSAPYLKGVPTYLPEQGDADYAVREKVAELAKGISDLVRRRDEVANDRESVFVDRRVAFMKKEINDLVFRLYKVTESEREIVRHLGRTDEGSEDLAADRDKK